MCHKIKKETHNSQYEQTQKPNDAKIQNLPSPPPPPPKKEKKNHRMGKHILLH